jgi:hypothetical protein
MKQLLIFLSTLLLVSCGHNYENTGEQKRLFAERKDQSSDTLIAQGTSSTDNQKCICDKDTMLKELISCDTIRFDNKASLFWSFNCDSSWLTFQSPEESNTIIFSMGLVRLTGRLGHIYLCEYKNTFLVQNNVISGCCSPPEFYLYDKFTGNLKADLGRLVFYSQDRKIPLLIGVTNSNYDTTSTAIYNSLTVYNADTDKEYLIELKRGQIDKALKDAEEMYPESLFEEPVLNGTILKLTFRLKGYKSNKAIKKITIDLKKYLN